MQQLHLVHKPGPLPSKRSNTSPHDAAAGLPVALALNAPLPPMAAAPPHGTGAMSAWTLQAHSVAGPLGLLCSALFEFRAAIRPTFACAAFPAIRLPHQHVHRHVDILALEGLAAAAQRTRTDYAELHSFDWNLYHLAAGKLSAEE